MSDDVLVVGDLMVDVVVARAGPLHRASDTPATIRSLGGGSAANTACWLAALGRPVRLVAAVGDDPIGRGAVAELATAGVRFAGPTDPDHATGTCVVLVDPDGERTMLPDRGANDALPVAAVEAAFDDPPAWVHLSGYALLHDGSRAAGLAAVDLARRQGVPLSIDAASAAPLRAVGASRFLAWAAGSQVAFANDDELAALGGETAVLEHAASLVTKHGADGASWAAADGGRGTVAAVPVAVVDTVGAGDAFDAGVIDALLRGLHLDEALAAGAQTAATAVTTTGARPPRVHAGSNGGSMGATS